MPFLGMAASRQIIDLRNLLAERFQHPPAVVGGQISIPLLERATDGGLCKGAITEIICPNTSAGSALLIHCLLQIAQRDRFFLPSSMVAIRSMSNLSPPVPCNICFGS